MNEFRIDVHKQSGEVRLWMKGHCGTCFIPIIGWASIEGLKEFAHMLLGFYNERTAGTPVPDQVSENLLRQAFGEDTCL